MPDSNGTHKSKERLQQQVESKRDEIVNTVDEIRLTLSEEMRERKKAVRNATDWRYYVRKQPVATVGGALVVGLMVGKMVTNKIIDSTHHHEPTWQDRAHDLGDRARHLNDRARDRARDYASTTRQKLDEWSGRARGESKWKARSRSMMSSGGDLLLRELTKAAQRMIVPTVIAAVTGKAAAGKKPENKTTVVEKNIYRTPGSGVDREYTSDVRTYEDPST